MIDKRKQIPKLAYIEMQILQKAFKTDALVPSARHVEEEQKYPKDVLGNGGFQQVRVISLLYCLIVIPKELWNLKKDHEIFKSIDEKWLLTIFVVKKHKHDFFDNTTYNIIHCIRNSISHANFSHVGTEYEFWDQYPNTKEEHTMITAPIEKLEVFIAEVGSLFANFEE